MPLSEIYRRLVLDRGYKSFVNDFQEYFHKVNKAHLIMLKETEVITPEAAHKIKMGIEKLKNTFNPPDEIPVGVEDLFFLYEKALSEEVGNEIAGSLHTARSRNDMDSTIFRMFIRDKLIAFLENTLKLLEELQLKIEYSKKDFLIMFTHGQPAQVSTLAHYLSALAADLIENTNGLIDSLENVNTSSMGACAITTTGFNIDRERVGKLLGFDGFVMNSYQAIVTTNWLAYPAMWLKRIMTLETGFAADVLHKASCEVGILEFPDDLVQISSIMPQKRNPVVIEHIRIQAGLAIGMFEGIERIFQNAPYQDINELSDAPTTYLGKAIDEATSSLLLLKEMINKMSVDEDSVKRIAASMGVTTTELADELARRDKIAFRTTHGIASAFVDNGLTYKGFKKAYKDKTGHSTNITEEELNEILSIENFANVRKVPGGPAPEGMKPVIDKAKSDLENLHNRIYSIKRLMSEADSELEKVFVSL